MSKYKIINLADKIFITVTVFLIIYAWIYFFTKNLILTFVLSLIFSSAIVWLIFYFSEKKRSKIQDSLKHSKELDEKFLTFRLLDNTTKFKVLNDHLKQNYETKFNANTLTYKQDGQNRAIIIATHIEKISNFDVVNLIAGITKFDVIEIICNDSLEAINTNILRDAEIVILNKQEFYEKYLKHLDLNYPILNKKIQKSSLKIIIKNFFIPKKSKPYFLAGLIMFFSCLILPYHYYYLIFSTIFFVLSLLCKILPYFKTSRSATTHK